MREEALRLTHEGYLRNSIELLIRDCAAVKGLSHGRNPLINQVSEDLLTACNKALEDLKAAPYRVTKEEWNKYLKPMGLFVR